MIKEYSAVVAIKDLSDKVKSGCVGAVVMIYNFPNLPLGYEVEFFDSDGWTLDVLTVEPNDIKLR